ncbi:prostaglandin reductase 1-like [Liolophura sinensis]|uniref:prostaglandin reductase 1-like n=1 Tax=Liolophura sinensis TaxID=3198878 RepID=UPI0031581D91
MVKAKKWILAHHFDGNPKDSDMKLVEETLPELKDGDVLLEAVYLTVDPYMRPFSAVALKEGDTMMGTQVALVKESRNPKFPKGTYVDANVGWRTHTVTSDESLLRKFPPFGELPLSYAVGALGMPGMTAYYGLLEILKPKKGEVILVNGAAGAVGSLVGQIAKLKGCKVIAFAGSPEKCKWLKDDLKFDHVFNYKQVKDQEKAIREASPDGLDCFFDNVGGESFTAGLRCMKDFGRIAVCGCISSYNDKGEEKQGPYPNALINRRQLRVEGFLGWRWMAQWDEATLEMIDWIRQGKLVVKESVTEGFDNMRSAFYGLFKGNNIGKAVIKV